MPWVSTINAEAVINLRKLGLSQDMIAYRLGCSQSLVSRILRKHQIESSRAKRDLPLKKRKKSVYGVAIIAVHPQVVIDLHKTGRYTQHQIADKLGCTRQHVSQVISKVRRKGTTREEDWYAPDPR